MLAGKYLIANKIRKAHQNVSGWLEGFLRNETRGFLWLVPAGLPAYTGSRLEKNMASSFKFTEAAEISSAEKEAVNLQVDRLLSSSHFRNSRRYTDLLRFVVHQTLEGRADSLKERTLGIEVFGREPNFDTAGDSIVRVAAAEVRKRLAQYYQEEGHEQELRIDLPSGSYVAHFRRPPAPPPAAVEAEAAAPLRAISEPSPVPKLGISARSLQISLLTIVCMGIAFGILLATRYLTRHDAQKVLFDPFWKSPHDVTLCVGSPLLAENQPGAEGPAAARVLGEPTANNTVLPFADAIAISRLQILLNNRGKPSRVQLARATTFSDLRAGPTILIGALDNPWTMRLTGNLRFNFAGTDAEKGEIVDSNGKSGQRWTVDFHVPYSDRTQDYAVVAITHDPTLDQPLIVAAGIGPNGTMAASEFLLDADDLAALLRMAPAKWGGKNVEAVLATQVIQGNSGPPQVVATAFW